MKSILVTTDFSPHSNYSLRYILEWLKDIQSPTNIILLNTYLVDMKNDHQHLLQLNDQMRLESKKKLELQKAEALTWVKNSFTDIKTASHMGTLTNVMTNLIRTEQIDLVVMGKNGGGHVEQIVDLLKKQRCPLLITYNKEQHDLQIAVS